MRKFLKIQIFKAQKEFTKETEFLRFSRKS